MSTLVTGHLVLYIDVHIHERVRHYGPAAGCRLSAPTYSVSNFSSLPPARLAPALVFCAAEPPPQGKGSDDIRTPQSSLYDTAQAYTTRPLKRACFSSFFFLFISSSKALPEETLRTPEEKYGRFQARTYRRCHRRALDARRSHSGQARRLRLPAECSVPARPHQALGRFQHHLCVQPIRRLVYQWRNRCTYPFPSF